MASLRTRKRANGTEYFSVLYRLDGKQISASLDDFSSAEKFCKLADNFGVENALGTLEAVNSGSGLPLPYGDGQWHERAYGQSEYPRVGDNGELRMSGYNMATVLAGLPDDTIAPPENLPPPTMPLGPRGFLVPNPDYHP